MPVVLRDIYAARRAIAPWVRRTPLVHSPALSERTGASVYLKLETTHDIGSFKIRGATNRILQLSEQERRRGIVAVSTGNHGRAVAYAANRLGIRAVVCMPRLVRRNKLDAIRRLRADVRLCGDSQDEAETEARRLVAEEGLTLVHPFDDAGVISGQGTIGLEILEDFPEVNMLITGLSGGGLLGGVATVLKSASPGISTVGVSMDRGPAMIRSLEAGRPVPVEELPTLADCLGGGIGLTNRYTFDMIQRLVDQTVTLNEVEIAAGMRALFRDDRVVAEGGGAVAVGALLGDKITDVRGNVVCIISGENVDMDVFQAVVDGSYTAT